MPLVIAVRLCPEAIFIEGNFTRYREFAFKNVLFYHYYYRDINELLPDRQYNDTIIAENPQKGNDDLRPDCHYTNPTSIGANGHFQSNGNDSHDIWLDCCLSSGLLGLGNAIKLGGCR